jgi:hypothetical protein
MPIGIPITVVIRIPRSRPPFTFKMSRTDVKIRPMTNSRAEPCVRLPRLTNVASLFIITSEL